MNIINNLWVEKYRPKELKDLVLPDEYRADFEKVIQTKEPANYLFSGPPGSGKTAITRILCSKYGIIQNKSDNVLELNGSAKETRSINYVDTVIEPYLKVPVSPPDKYKIVFIDEFDHFTEASFSSLRGIIEKYLGHARFFTTCNYISKVPEPVQSRFQQYIFKQMPIEFVVDYCKNILEIEKINFDQKDLKYIVDNLYPDIRSVINALQRRSITGKLIIDKNSILTNEKIIIGNVIEIISFILGGEDHKINSVVNNIIKLSGEIDLDYRTIFSDLFFRDTVPAPAKIIINKYSNSHGDCLLPSMNFMSAVFEIIQVLQKYKQLVGKK